MNIKIDKCPNCGAECNLNVTIQSKCDYCGSKFNFSPSAPLPENTSKNIDSETKKYIQLHSRLETENNKYLSNTGDYKHPGSILDQKND